MRRVVELIGGRFDGLVGEVSDAAIAQGCVVVTECARHGMGAFCQCEDAYWYGYFSEPSRGAGRFVVRDMAAGADETEER